MTKGNYSTNPPPPPPSCLLRGKSWSPIITHVNPNLYILHIIFGSIRLLAWFTPKLTELLSQIIPSFARKVPLNSGLRSLVEDKYCVFLSTVVAYSRTDCFPERWPLHTTGHAQRPKFDPRSVHVRFVAVKSSTGPGFSPSTSFVSPDSTIPPMLHIQLHVQVALTTTKGRSLKTISWEIGKRWTDK